MRYVTAWVAALICSGLGSSAFLVALVPGGTVEVSLTLDWTLNPRALSPAFIGVAVAAGDHGNGLAAEGLETAAVASTAQLQASLARFPGDESQSYRWLDWEGSTVSEKLDTYEFASLSRQAEIPNLMVTVNMATGTADEATNWVLYCNAPPGNPMSDRRVTRGSQAPFGVGYWMLGEDILDHQDRFASAQDYAIAAVENATRMKAASPAIKVGVWVDDGQTADGERWNGEMLASIAGLDPGQVTPGQPKLIDFVAVRILAEVPDRPLTDASLYPTLYSFAADVAEARLTKAEQAVIAGLRDPVPVAVYRYGIDFSRAGWNQDKADSLGTAIALAGMVNAFARHDQTRLLTAVYDGLNARGFHALLKVPSFYDLPHDELFTLNPFGEILGSYGQNLKGDSLQGGYQGVGAAQGKAFYNTRQIGRLPASDSVPLLTFAASVDLAEARMSLFVGSRSLHDRVVVHVTVSPTPARAVNGTAVFEVWHGDAPAIDSYTGAVTLTPVVQRRDLTAAPPDTSGYHFDLVLERNTFASYIFTV